MTCPQPERAHALVMDEDGSDSAWVHAYLHRREGDLDNAHYWYAKAGKTSGPPDGEWDRIAAVLLGAGTIASYTLDPAPVARYVCA